MTKLEKWASCNCPPSKTPCPHLEALLPSMEMGAVRIIGSEDGSSGTTADFFQSHFWSFDSSKFVELMRNYGFTDEWDLELLEAKYCRNLSAADVASEQNYVSKDKVKRRLRQLRQLLRERGFSQEME